MGKKKAENCLLKMHLSGTFPPAYTIVQRHEGGYANDPDDIGGETYRGIARAVWPQWEGWRYIDLWKIELGLSENRAPRNNEFATAATSQHADKIDQLVRQFYFNLWQASRADQITDQQVANAYFDLYVLSSQAVKTMQQALNTLPGVSVSVDNRIGPETISAINAAPAEELLEAFADKRIEFHHSQISKGIVNAKYLEGWIKRAEAFLPDVEIVPMTGIIAVTLIGGYFLYRYQKQTSKN